MNGNKSNSEQSYIKNDPLWYKDAIIYELHVKAFFDSKGDGTGDLNGITKKLDYLLGLGINTIWLLPFYPSPYKDDGYDISDYVDINTDFGNLSDIKRLLKEAHKRGIRVITELVLNHTSDQHIWFQKSRRAKPGSVWRNYYVWSDTHNKYKDARIIFKDFEKSNWTWDEDAGAYFWHRFYSNQPDLNYESPHVQSAMLKVVDYWFEMGVDGLRLDAVPYLYEEEGTNCENLPKTYEFLKKLRAHIDSKFTNRMLLAEANQWTEDTAAYFGDGDMCNMAYHFPLMPRMFMALHMEDRFPIINIMEQTPAIHPNSQWALFLRNHDELTLEMVADEERDYMYRVYASDPTSRINLGIRRRLAPLLGNDLRKIQLMNVMLFSFPGTPFIYYGDEIGMGDNFYLGDRNGVRTPMQWNADRNAGFSKANPQKLYLPVIIDPDYHYEAVNVESQDRNQSSLLWWMKKLIAVRKQYSAFGRGTISFITSENPKILSFIRSYEEENILVLINLSRHTQMVELDLSRFAGYIPQEIFGKIRFPQIKTEPYIFTFSPYGYYSFSLFKENSLLTDDGENILHKLNVYGNWESIFDYREVKELEEKVLPAYLMRCRWFGGKSKTIIDIKIIENFAINIDTLSAAMLFLSVRYSEGQPQTYLLPIKYISGEEASKIIEEFPKAVICKMRVENIKGVDTKMPIETDVDVIERYRVASTEGILYDAVYDKSFRKYIFNIILKHSRLRGLKGMITSQSGRYLKTLNPKIDPMKSTLLNIEQSNTSIFYDNTLIFKLFRKLEEGINPDLEIPKYLFESGKIKNNPAFGGSIQYDDHGKEPVILGILQEYITNQGDAWKYTLDELDRFFERVLASNVEPVNVPHTPYCLKVLDGIEIPDIVREQIGGVYLEMADMIGKKTAELHIALSQNLEPHFKPEPFSLLYQKSLYQSLLSLLKHALSHLKKRLKTMPEPTRLLVAEILDNEGRLINMLKEVYKRNIDGYKIRIHGDFHLGQILNTGNDFVIIDFEGEPARALSQRRLKRSPFVDVAGMIRSFHYASHSGLQRQISISPANSETLKVWADIWYTYVTGTYIKSYLEAIKDAPFAIQETSELKILLNAYIIEKAVYEVEYELNNRPDWVEIPLSGIKRLLDAVKE